MFLRQWGPASGLAVVLVLLGGVHRANAQNSVPSPPGTALLTWDYSGPDPEWFEVVADNAPPASVGLPERDARNALSVPFPLLFPGQHVIVIRACNAEGCTPSEPFYVNVFASAITAPAPSGPVNPPRPSLPPLGDQGGWTVFGVKPKPPR